jgi:hypothetical protein
MATLLAQKKLWLITFKTAHNEPKVLCVEDQTFSVNLKFENNYILVNSIPTPSIHVYTIADLRHVLNELCGPHVGWSWPALVYSVPRKHVKGVLLQIEYVIIQLEEVSCYWLWKIRHRWGIVSEYCRKDLHCFMHCSHLFFTAVISWHSSSLFVLHTSIHRTSSCHVNQLNFTEQSSTTIICNTINTNKEKRMSFFSCNRHRLKGTRGKENCFTKIFEERKTPQKKGH